MKELEEQLEKIVSIIYMPDKPNFETEFVALLDLIEKNLSKISDVNRHMLSLQNAYVKKDYVDLADELLYELKPQLIDA